MSRSERISERWAIGAGVAAMFVVVSLLAGFSLVTQRRTTDLARSTEVAHRLEATLDTARHWVGEEKSVEREYRLAGSYRVRAEHAAAGRRLVAALRDAAELQRSDATRREIAGLLTLQRRYDDASSRLFAAVDAGDAAGEQHWEHEVIDPTYGVLEAGVERAARTTSAAGLAGSAKLRGLQGNILVATTFAFAFGIGLLAWLTRGLVRVRRRLMLARAAEVDRLSQIAMSDPLTGLRNHRAFQEALARELQRVGRTGEPLALVLLDVDDLKTANDTDGHQAGDERLQALAEAIRATRRATDCGYRIGGDEFAVVLPGARALGAMEFAQRVRSLTREGAHGVAFTATAGISEAVALRSRDEVVREADLALIGAKRVHQDVAIYGPDLEVSGETTATAEDEHHTRTLASALAQAVDAKDAYTRSHCQTVSQLSATIAAEIGFTGERLGRMRLAGLLHDVGKIGVPDAILNKPAKLTSSEYAVMQRHALLGCDIVRAADMPVEARWVRHHHERFDGGGYPDGLTGDSIPLESRIILVADAFEAMTSDRPYRKAPGEEFALAELRRNAGTQFDPDVVAALCRVLDRGGIGASAEPEPALADA